MLKLKMSVGYTLQRGEFSYYQKWKKAKNNEPADILGVKFCDRKGELHFFECSESENPRKIFREWLKGNDNDLFKQYREFFKFEKF